MTDDMKTTSEPWKKIADMWNIYFAPPSRISANEFDKYREWLRQKNSEKKPLNALVLGATPEIRDVLTENGYRTTVLDINLEMILAMNSLVKLKNPKEILVQADWLDNPLQESYYDVIIGDAVLPNIHWNQRDAMLNEVSRLLKSGGLFITRSFCVPRHKPFADINEILIHFSDRAPTYMNSLQLVLELQILAYDPRDHLGTFTKPRDMLTRLKEEKGFDFHGENLRKLLDMVWDVWCNKFIDKVFVYEYRDEEEREYRRFFDISDTFEAGDHPYSKLTPMYILKKKN